MGQTATQSLYDLLGDSQKNKLIAIKDRIHSSGSGSLDTSLGTRVIEILESWLLDDEQIQHLEANTWDIFFLYAACSLLNHQNIDVADGPAGVASPENTTKSTRTPEPVKPLWPPLEIADRQQAQILASIGQGYVAASTMAEAIPPRSAYDGEKTVNIQFLAACLRLAMDFNLAAPETLNHLRNLLPPAVGVTQDSALDQHFTVVSSGAHPHVQATILVQVHCRDAETHRALKRYESYLQRLLYNLNRIIRPRFLFTAVRFEITAQDYRPIALNFVDEKGAHTILGQETLNYDEEIRWGTKFTAKLDFESSRGYLLLKVQENHQYIYDMESSRGGVSIFQDGIFITQVDYLLPDSAGEHVIGRLNLVGDEKCDLSMDRNRLLWKKDQLAQIKKRFLMGLVVIVNRLLETLSRQSPPENIQRNIIQKVASFFDFNEVDDAVFDALNTEICVRVEDQFHRFIRIHHSRFDLLHNPESTALNSHGYIHRWQQRVIDGYKERGAGKVHRA